MRSGVLGGERVSLVGYLSQRGLRGKEDPKTLKERFQRTRLEGSKNLYKTDLFGHFGCVNAIEFSNRGGGLLVSGGDDRRVLLWHIEKTIHNHAKPVQLKGQHQSNIFCLAFDSQNTRIFSGGNDEQVILHDIESGQTIDVFTHEEAVYGLSVNPVNDNVFASSADDGRVLIWDIRESVSGEPFCLAHYPSAFHSVMFNPAEPRLLATANSKEGVGLWDIRKPRSALLRYGGNLSLQSAMSVRFNGSGTQLLALRRRLPPVLYDIHSRLPIFQFDNQGYFNSCTMKSCCFAGDRDQYILSGSDDFNLYMWRIPSDPDAGGPGRVVNGAFLVLKGHRSIVNQVRFNRDNYMICSSGVEKIIKVWSPYRQPKCSGDLDGKVEDESRSLYSHEEYISLVLSSRSGDLSHDYANQSIQEDPRMMAFFDSLVRREVEGWSSDSESDISASTILQLRTGDRSAFSDSESSASLPQFPRQAEESDEMTYNYSLRATSEAVTREDVVSRRKRLMALRRYQDARLLALNDSDSDDNSYHQMDTDSDTDPIPRPRSPSPENGSSSSSSSSEEEDELNRRRASTRQRNASRQKQQQEERTVTNPENANVCTGVDIFEYPQIKVDDVSSSPASSPERCQVERPNTRGKVPLCSGTEYEERKIYKAYKWLQCSYKSQSASRAGERAPGLPAEHEEESPGTSGKGIVVRSCAKEEDVVDNRTSLTPPCNGDLPLEEVSRDSSSQMDHIFEERTSDLQQCHEDPARCSAQDNLSSSVERCYESRRVNGKALCKALSNQTEETCGHKAAVAEQRNSQDCQQVLGQSSHVITEDSFPVIVVDSVCADGKKKNGNESQSPVISEESCPETAHANHNGHLHSSAVHSSSSSRQGNGEQESSVPSSVMHCTADGGNLSQTDVNFYRGDCCISATDCSTNGVGTREDISGLHPRRMLPGDDSQAHTGFKRHRTEMEDVDSENTVSEKKLKT